MVANYMCQFGLDRQKELGPSPVTILQMFTPSTQVCSVIIPSVKTQIHVTESKELVTGCLAG